MQNSSSSGASGVDSMSKFYIYFYFFEQGCLNKFIYRVVLSICTSLLQDETNRPSSRTIEMLRRQVQLLQNNNGRLRTQLATACLRRCV